MNEELGRHRGREVKSACSLCPPILGYGYTDFAMFNNAEKPKEMINGRIARADH